MKMWGKSKASNLYYSKEAADEDYSCAVKITDEEILVEYKDEDGALVQYRGKNNGTGHFELSAPEFDGKATLHMFPDSQLLEGSWIEGGVRGMWRIKLFF